MSRLNIYLLGPRKLDPSSKTTHMVLFPGLNSPIQVKIPRNIFFCWFCPPVLFFDWFIGLDVYIWDLWILCDFYDVFPVAFLRSGGTVKLNLSVPVELSNLIKIWPKSGQNLTNIKIWSKSGQHLANIWSTSRQNLLNIWPNSGHADHVSTRPSCAVDAK